jgi:hypothetical protein
VTHGDRRLWFPLASTPYGRRSNTALEPSALTTCARRGSTPTLDVNMPSGATPNHQEPAMSDVTPIRDPKGDL